MRSGQLRYLILLQLALVALVVSGCTLLGIGFGGGTEVGEDDGSWVPGAVVLRFAVIGDAEPKPVPIFDQFAGAVDAINQLTLERPIDFVGSVGDIAHKGTIEQYEAATAEIERLVPPFYAIMGNEEYEVGVSRFLEYAEMWNDEITSPRYVVERAGVIFIFATPDVDGYDFTDEAIDWLRDQIETYESFPVVLFTHTPMTGVFPVNVNRIIHHPGFQEILAYENVVAHFSGHLHFNLDHVTHYVQQEGVHHVHVPGIERTKRPNDVHVPRFRVVTLYDNGAAEVETYNVDDGAFEPEHRSRFMLRMTPAK